MKWNEMEGTHVNTRQTVLFGDLLRPQMLLHRDGIVRAALHSGVIRNDHTVMTME